MITEEDQVRIIIEALYKNGLINVPTYKNIQKAYTNTPRRGTEPLIGISLGQYALNVRDAVNFSRFTRKRINLREFSVITVNIFFTF